YGPDLNRLEAYAKSFEPKIADIQGIEDLYSGVSEPSAELDMRVNEAEANRVGLTPQKVADAATGALLGAPAGEVRLEDRGIGDERRKGRACRAPPSFWYEIGARRTVREPAGRVSGIATRTCASRGERRRGDGASVPVVRGSAHCAARGTAFIHWCCRASAHHWHTAERFIVHGPHSSRRPDREERNYPARFYQTPNAGGWSPTRESDY